MFWNVHSERLNPAPIIVRGYKFAQKVFRENARLVAVGIYSAMVLLPRVVSSILTLLYTQIFSVEEFGTFGVLNSILGVSFVVVDLGLSYAVLRNYCDKSGNMEEGRRYISSVLKGAGLSSLAVLPIVALVLAVFWNAFGIGRANIYILVALVVAISYADRSVEIRSAVCRAIERPTYYALGCIVYSVVMIISAVCLVWGFHFGVAGALISMLLGRVTSTLAYQITLDHGLKLPRAKVNWDDLKACLEYGVPLVPNRIAGWCKELALRPVVASMQSLSAAGFFSLASSFSSLPILIAAPIELAIMPVYFKKRYSSGPEFQHKMMTFIKLNLAFLLPIWVFLILFSDEIITHFFGEKYASAGQVTAILIFASFLRPQQAYLSQQISYLRKTWILPCIAIPLSLLSIVLTAVMSSSFGLLAPGIGVALADLCICIAMILAITRYEPLNYPLWDAILLVAFLAIITGWGTLYLPGLFGIARLVSQVAVLAVCLCISFFVYLWPNRSFIRSVVFK